MVRQLLAASVAVIAVTASPLAPYAAADDGQVVITQNGTVRCLVSADNVARGGGPMVVCTPSDGAMFGRAPFTTEKYPQTMNLAIERGTGEFYFDAGAVDSAGAITLNTGQTYHINGWTIQPDPQRTRFTNDVSGHGVLVNAIDARNF